MEKKNRIWEIDFLRGIAFLCMVYDHVIFDLNSIFGIRTNILWGYDNLIGDFSALLFMILCGISTAFSKNCIKRGLTVFGFALGLSLVTFLIDLVANNNLFIKFGILHMLGIAMILSYLIRKLPNWLILIISAVIYALSIPFVHIKTIGNFLFAFGIHDSTFCSGDYYPLVPYLAFVFVGVALGKILYKEKKSLFKFSIPDNPISFIGRHSLLLYLTHQPIVIAILFIIIRPKLF